MRTELVRVLPEGSHDEDNPVLPSKCFYCGLNDQDEVSLCNWCRSVYFCRKHHSMHRSRSKCSPYVIRDGHKLLASRDIKPGENILAEIPAIVAPAPSSTPVCVSCLGKLKNIEEDRCKKCNLPVCSQKCQDSIIHKPECKIFQEDRVKTKMMPNAPNGFYTCIAPIRMMSLKSSEESKMDLCKPIFQLPDHVDEIARSEKELIGMEVVAFLHDRCFLKNQVTEEDLFKYAGIFMVNGVTIGNVKGPAYGKALYPVFSHINHNCLANAKYKIDINSWEVQVRAQKAISKGEEITIQYLSTVLGTHKRRKRIKGEWYFDCTCQRCQDPTELETFVSALICEVCEEDFLLPTEPLDMFSPWTCGSCDFFLSSTVVEAKIDTIEDELSAATSKRDLRALEDFVQHYSEKILHSNHYLLLLAKRNYLFISRKNLIDLMTKCNTEEQMELKAAFKNKNELFREFWWIPDKHHCAETF